MAKTFNVENTVEVTLQNFVEILYLWASSRDLLKKFSALIVFATSTRTAWKKIDNMFVTRFSSFNKLVLRQMYIYGKKQPPCSVRPRAAIEELCTHVDFELTRQLFGGLQDKKTTLVA